MRVYLYEEERWELWKNFLKKGGSEEESGELDDWFRVNID